MKADCMVRYVYLLASIPAVLLTILLFMDQQITSVIVNRKEHKLRVRQLTLLLYSVKDALECRL
jgi:hypothetical protein